MGEMDGVENLKPSRISEKASSITGIISREITPKVNFGQDV
jgi:hypothetical protein